MQYTRLWHKILRRRIHKIRITWARMKTLAQTWLPTARILPPRPEQRFNVFIQGKSRMHYQCLSGSPRGAAREGGSYGDPKKS
jgi:hypothetical protein